MSDRVTVIIPNWNGAVHLGECLDSLAKQTFTDFVVTVVDNGSTDESLNMLAERYPNVQVIALAANGGFAAAVNAGIRSSKAEFIALLNNDTRVDPAWLRELVDALDANSGFSVAASLMLLHDAAETVNAAGDVYDLRGFAGLNRGIWEPMSEYLSPRRVLGACAGAALYRREFFDEVGLFDEDFFVGSEDTDLNLRALIAGCSAVYVPSARVWHKLKATRGLDPAWSSHLREVRNNVAVVAKDLPWRYVALWLIEWPLRILRAAIPLRPSKWGPAPATFRRARDLFTSQRAGLRMGFEKRAGVWSRRAVPVTEIVAWLRVGSRDL